MRAAGVSVRLSGSVGWALAAASMLAGASWCLARTADATAWWLTTTDGRVRRVEVVSAGEMGLRLRDGESLGWGGVVRLEAEVEAAESATSGDLVLVLRDGQRWAGGADESSEGELLVWKHAVLGRLPVRLDRVRAIERRGSGTGVGGGGMGGGAVERHEGTEDVVRLENGDEVRGVVSAVSGVGLVVQSGSGGEVRLPWSAVGRVSLADLGGAAPTGGAEGGFVQLELRDGTVVRGAGVELEGGRVTLVMSDEPRAIEAREIVCVERVGGGGPGGNAGGGGVWGLTLLAPVAGGVEHTPFLSAGRPPVVDGSVFGRALRWEGRGVRRGLGLTARTRMTWAVPEGLSEGGRLRMGLRMDEQAPRGRAVVRVVWSGEGAEDRVLFEHVLSRATEWTEVPLPGGAGRLTIEADFGPSGGVQPWVNVLDPVLLR